MCWALSPTLVTGSATPNVRDISDATAEAVSAITDHIEPDSASCSHRQNLHEIGYAIALRDHQNGDLDPSTAATTPRTPKVLRLALVRFGLPARVWSQR